MVEKVVGKASEDYLLKTGLKAVGLHCTWTIVRKHVRTEMMD